MSSKASQRMCLIIVLAFLFSIGRNANADFVFGTPIPVPNVNSSSDELTVNISLDGLSLYLSSTRPGGLGGQVGDIWVAKRETTNDPWGTPVNLGPTVNSSVNDFTPSISPDGLSLYFASTRSGGSGGWDLWVTTRATIDDPWGDPVNLGPNVNSSAWDWGPSISADGLSLYIVSGRAGGFGSDDIHILTRPTIDDPWSAPVNLGPTVNSSSPDGHPNISPDGLSLFFGSGRAGRPGMWMTTRATKEDDWGTPVYLGLPVNSSQRENDSCLSADGSTLYFVSNRSGGVGGVDLWQVAIEPVVDLNGDGTVDAADICLMLDYWGTDEPLCDIGPMPWGDGIVDVQDLIVLAEHLFEEFPPIEVEPAE